VFLFPFGNDLLEFSLLCATEGLGVQKMGTLADTNLLPAGFGTCVVNMCLRVLVPLLALVLESSHVFRGCVGYLEKFRAALFSAILEPPSRVVSAFICWWTDSRRVGCSNGGLSW